MTTLQRFTRCLVFLLAFAGAPACSDDPGPGGGAPGADASPGPIDAAPGAADAAATVEGLPFLAACATNEQCASGLCFNFNARGLHCTHACASATDCEAPSPGCNGMNVCKAP